MAKTTFSASFLTQIKQTLVEEKEKFEKELGQFTSPNPHVKGDFEADYPEYGDESDENAREIADYTAKKPLEITLEKQLRDINKSLTRLEDGSYGVCKYCEKPIDEKRLLARPTSGSCVSCKKTLKDEV